MPFGENTLGTLYATTVDGERVVLGEATLSEVDTYLAEYQYVRVVRCKDCKHYDGRPCGKVDWYNSADDFCSKAERRHDEHTGK